MNHIDPPTINLRRTFFGRLAGVAAIGLSGLLPARSNAQPAHDGTDWPGKLPGRHLQVVDGYEINGGSPLEWAHNFLATDPTPGEASVVVILRAGALPIALNNAMWEKYKIGESFKIIDPETNAPALKNPFLHPKPGVMRSDAAAIDRMLAAGAVIGACEIALRGQAKKLAPNAGMSADDTAAEWIANVVPGVSVIASGVWGVNRAQEAGCTYCTGG